MGYNYDNDHVWIVNGTDRVVEIRVDRGPQVKYGANLFGSVGWWPVAPKGIESWARDRAKGPYGYEIYDGGSTTKGTTGTGTPKTYLGPNRIFDGALTGSSAPTSSPSPTGPSATSISSSTTSSQWQNWQNIPGGTITSAPALASWDTGRLDCFARSTSGELVHRAYHSGQWQTWGSLGGVIQGAPSAVSWGVNRIDVAVRGMDNSVWLISWNGSRWTDWANLGGNLTITSSPALCSMVPGELLCFARGPNGELLHRTFRNNIWSHWSNLGGVIQGAPSAVSWGANRLDCVVRGTDNQLWMISWNGQWSNWATLGGGLTITASPALASMMPGELDCFARGPNGELLYREFRSNRWNNWVNLGGVMQDAPGAVSWGPNRLDCLVWGTDNTLWTRIFA